MCISTYGVCRRRFATAGLVLSALLSTVGSLLSQSVDDAVMMPNRVLATGIVLGHESWDWYWEGSLKRNNENIGRLTSRTATWMAGYGVTGRLTLIAALPYVENRTSRGTLKDMHGLQDVSVAAKYRLASVRSPGAGKVSAIVVGAVGLPVGDYSPDFLPLSIGLGSRRVSGRFTLDLRREDGWFLAASTAYTWRGNVKLDRAAYYTGGELYLGDEVRMPDVFDFTASAGYRNGRLHVPLSLTEQRTRGGSDIRRQDMPFVSNRMDFVRLDGAVAYTFPAPGLVLRAGAGRVLTGRNVGQSTTFSAGVLYTIPF